MGETIIRTEGLTRVFSIAGGEELKALDTINISIARNTLTILRGRSGSGKTTLLNILGALDKPTAGIVLFDGEEITSYGEKKREQLRREKMGFIFQSVSLIPIMTAYENVEFALRLAGTDTDRTKRVEECLRLVGLSSEMHHMPQELSGGEQQRVAIARAIVHKPNVIFADEPTAELDSNSALTVMRIFKELIAKEGITIVMTTHDVGLMGAADASYELEDGEIIHE